MIRIVCIGAPSKSLEHEEVDIAWWTLEGGPGITQWVAGDKAAAEIEEPGSMVIHSLYYSSAGRARGRSDLVCPRPGCRQSLTARTERLHRIIQTLEESGQEKVTLLLLHAALKAGLGKAPHQ